MAVPADIVIDVARNGDWLPLAEFRALALAAAGAEGKVILNFDGIDYLDCGALQVALALGKACRTRRKALGVTNLSPSVSRWLEWAGSSATLLERSESQEGEAGSA